MLGEDQTNEIKAGNKGAISVVLSSIGVGVEANKSNKQEETNKAQTCIKFSVPVILPSIDNGEIEEFKVSRLHRPH